MADLINKLNELSSEFKSAIDRKDKAAEDRLNTKIADLEAQIKQLSVASGRPVTGQTFENDAETKSFASYLRNGQVTPEMKAMSAVVPGEGGYTVPKVIDSEIRKLMVNISPMRSVARVISVSTPDFRIPVALNTTASAWVGEKAARPETAAPSITEVAPKFGELYASPFVTPVLLEDSQFDIAGFVAGEVATEFARNEGEAFLKGDGVNKPAGLLTTTTNTTADASRAFGTAQHLVTSTVGAITADDLIALVHLIKAGYRVNAKFIMTKATKAAIRGLKDTTGQFIWQQGLQAGDPDRLLGYEVVEMEDMPEIAGNANAVLFGDFAAAYTIADRTGVSMLYNPYSNAPYIAYQSRKRVGGVVVNTEAYKVLRIRNS